MVNRSIYRRTRDIEDVSSNYSRSHKRRSRTNDNGTVFHRIDDHCCDFLNLNAEMVPVIKDYRGGVRYCRGGGRALGYKGRDRRDPNQVPIEGCSDSDGPLICLNLVVVLVLNTE